MAGISESAPRQLKLLDDQAKQNIAEYYLKEALASADAEKHNPWNYSLGRFENIRIPLRQQTGLELPPSLVRGLNLEKLNWQILGVNPVSIILIGGNFLQPSNDTANGTEKASLNEALAVIDITRQGNPNLPYEEWKPFHLRVAGVLDGELGGKRVIAATYDLEDKNRLTKLNVSLSIDEVLADLSFWYQNLGLFTTLTVNFPTQIAKPYKTAGLVTQAMYEEIKKIMSVSALTVQITPHRCLIGKPSSSLEERTLNEKANALGYGVDRTDVGVSVGLTREAAERRGVAPWEIILPEFLPKA